MSKHSEKPFYIDSRKPLELYDNEGGLVAKYCTEFQSQETAEANCRLGKAGPALLNENEALRAAVGEMRDRLAEELDNYQDQPWGSGILIAQEHFNRTLGRLLEKRTGGDDA